jgi:hypothetical protein
MPQEKVDASRHNAKAAPGNNPPSGSNHSAPPFFDGGGGSTTKEFRTELVGKPPPIKKEGKDFCSAGKPCGSLWNTHSNKIALKLHLGYLFGINWPTVVTILKDYSVDHINQNIHDTERFIKEELAQGRTIRTYAGCFMHQLQGSFYAEPELSPEAMRERDVTLARDFESLRKPSKDKAKDYLSQRPLCGCPDFLHRPPCKHYRGIHDGSDPEA